MASPIAAVASSRRSVAGGGVQVGGCVLLDGARQDEVGAEESSAIDTCSRSGVWLPGHMWGSDRGCSFRHASIGPGRPRPKHGTSRTSPSDDLSSCRHCLAVQRRVALGDFTVGVSLVKRSGGSAWHTRVLGLRRTWHRLAVVRPDEIFMPARGRLPGAPRRACPVSKRPTGHRPAFEPGRARSMMSPPARRRRARRPRSP